MSLGERISALRAQRGLSQSELADRLEVSRQSVSKWETDGAVPDLDKLVKLAQIFGVTLDELVLGIEEVPEEKAEEAPAAQTAAEPVHVGWPGRKIAGTVLFCMGFLTFLLITLLGDILSGLFLASPFLLCGAVCFLAKKRPGLWCGWTMFALADCYLRYATGTNWGMVRNTLLYWKAGDIIHPIMAWVELLLLVALIVATVRSYRSVELNWYKKTKVRLAVGWLVFAALNMPRVFSRALFEHTALFDRVGYSGLRLWSMLLDWLQVALLTLLLVLILAARRGKKRETDN